MATKEIAEVINAYTGQHEVRDSDFPFHFTVDNAREVLERLLVQLMGEVVWLKGYDKVVAWLADNKGKGIILMGGVGVGKTVLARQAIPRIINHYYRKLFYYCNAYQLNKAEVLARILGVRFKVIDDIGMEEEMNDYGVKRLPLQQVVHEAYERGDFLILTTNKKAPTLKSRYGERTWDRLRSMCQLVTIESKVSLRK